VTSKLTGVSQTSRATRIVRFVMLSWSGKWNQRVSCRDGKYLAGNRMISRPFEEFKVRLTDKVKPSLAKDERRSTKEEQGGLSAIVDHPPLKR
jgi:hypothetical protein